MYIQQLSQDNVFRVWGYIPLAENAGTRRGQGPPRPRTERHPLSTTNAPKLRRRPDGNGRKRWHADPRTSLAYRTACTSPPDGKLHPILQAQKRGWSIKDTRSKGGAEQTHSQPRHLALTSPRYSDSPQVTPSRASTRPVFFLKGKFPSHVSPKRSPHAPAEPNSKPSNMFSLFARSTTQRGAAPSNAQGRVRTPSQLFDSPLAARPNAPLPRGLTSVREAPQHGLRPGLRRPN